MAGSPTVRRSISIMRSSHDRRYRRQPKRVSATVTVVERRDGAGNAVNVTATLRGGATEYLNVAGLPGTDVGAQLYVLYEDSRAVGVEVKRFAPGTTSGASNEPLSTPVIDSVPTKVYIPPAILTGEASSTTPVGGQTPVTSAYVVARVIPEQHANLRVYYRAKVRRVSDKVEVGTNTIGPFGMVRGELSAELSDETVTAGQVIEIVGYDSEPLMGFPGGTYIIGLGDLHQADSEAVWVDGPPSVNGGHYELGLSSFVDTTTYDLRGYQGTAFPEGYNMAQTWVSGTVVILLGVGIFIQGLVPNVAYEASVEAIAESGTAQSNPSVWFPFTAAYDTSAPGWGSTPTPTVTNIDGRAWQVVMTYPTVFAGGIDDFANFELRHRDGQGNSQGSWSNWYEIGKGLTHRQQGEVGTYREFEYRAVDTSGNASAASNSAGAALIPPLPPVPNLLTNAGFESAIGSEWNAYALTSITFDRSTEEYLLGSYSGKMELLRHASIATTGDIRQDFGAAIPADTDIYVRGWFYVTDMQADEFLGLGLGSNPKPIAFYGEIPLNEWFMLEMTSTTSVASDTFYVAMTAMLDGTGTSEMTLYVDGLYIAAIAE